jgi:hypothetical protein
MKVRIPNEGGPAFPAWIRIAVGSFVTVTGALAFWTHPHDFLMGINQISLALFLFFMQFRQPNESFREFIVKPRAVITFASLLIIVASSLALLVRSFR